MTNLQVSGFLLILTLAISGCSSSPYYGEMSTANNYSQPKSIGTIMYNIAKHNAYSVPVEGRLKHEQCVYFALDELNIGEHCEWATRHAMGNVQVVNHYVAGSGYCTIIFNSVIYKGQTKGWKNTACVNEGRNTNWKFN